MIHMETVRLTASQALVRFLENQYISYIDMDGNEQGTSSLRASSCCRATATL